MKKIFILLISMFCCFALIGCAKGEDGRSIVSVILTSSNDNVDNYMVIYSDGSNSTFSITNGVNGKNGKSAYEIAVDNGFVGTEQEWLNSFGQNGKSAYEIAVDNGFIGTEQEWLLSINGIDGTNGINGKTAYEIAVDNGFEGTEEEWLLSLQGASGNDGKNGEDVIEDSYAMYISAKEKGAISEETTYVEFLGMIYKTNDDYTTANLKRSLYSSVSIFAYNSKYSNNHSSAGSGVIYKIFDNGDAFILTNYHVVYNNSSKNFYTAFKFSLFGQDDNLIEAEIFGSSRKYDLALLKVSQSEELLNSNAEAVAISEIPVSIGQVCFSIGNISEYGLSLTNGVVSVESEIVSMTIGGVSGKYRVIRHDSYTYHGSSGGGLFNKNGFIIGLNCGGRENTSMNYAIPINIVVSVADNLIKNKNQLRVYQTGIENNLVADNTISFFDVETSSIKIKEQIIISAIESNSLISQSQNIDISDEIISIKYNGKIYDNYENYNLRYFTLSELLISSNIGDEIELTIKKNNEIIFTETIVLDINHFTIIN